MLLHPRGSGTRTRRAYWLNELISISVCFSSATPMFACRWCWCLFQKLLSHLIYIHQWRFQFSLAFIAYCKRIFWVIFTILSIYHIYRASLGTPVALGFPFPSFMFMLCLEILLEMSFQRTFATLLTSCWAIRVSTDMPGSATSVVGELQLLPRTSLCFFYAVYTAESFSFAFTPCPSVSCVSTFSQLSATSSSSRSFRFMYVLVHLERISSRIWLSVSSPCSQSLAARLSLVKKTVELFPQVLVVALWSGV